MFGQSERRKVIICQGGRKEMDHMVVKATVISTLRDIRKHWKMTLSALHFNGSA